MIIYPIAYVLIESFLVVFIKLTSIDGKTSYNPITLNLITEVMKLTIALNIAIAEGSLSSLKNMDFCLFIGFLIPNLMYAVNNNLFHYSIGLLPPAIYIVTINAFRTILTGLLQPIVSNQPLNRNQIIACFLLAFSFVFTSLPEIIRAAFNNSFGNSTFSSLVYLSGIYTVISVAASLSQEKLLKNSKSVMSANVVNYSIGVVFQIVGLVYSKITYPDQSIARGLNIFWIQLIPVLMAFGGLSISLVLRYHDNIVKLICSSISVLLVNAITSYFTRTNFYNLSFMIGWSLTIPATILYSSKTNVEDKDKKNSKSLLPTTDSKKSQPPTENKKNKFEFVLASLILIFFMISFFHSSFEIQNLHVSHATSDSECKIFEGPDGKAKNLQQVLNLTVTYNTQFASINNEDGDIYILCPSKLFIIGPETDSYKSFHHNFNEWIPIDGYTSSVPIKLPWEKVDSIIGTREPYFWLYCQDAAADVNLIVRPMLAIKNDKYSQKPLHERVIRDMNNHIAETSRSIPGRNESVFDTVIVIYLDAISRIKFHKFYEKSANILKRMNEDEASTHRSISLDRFHAIGRNSEFNYLSFASGVGPEEIKQFFHRKDTDVHIPWIFDLAEMMGYETASTVSGCHYRCKKDCHDFFMSANGVETGGCVQQYMVEHDKRYPTKSLFPPASYCESKYRKILNENGSRSGSTVDTNIGDQQFYWVGNKFGMSYILDWFRTWLLQVYQKYHHKKKFSMIVFEETQQREFFTNVDSEIEAILFDLVYSSSKYHTENAAILLLSDHGLHFSSEFYVQPGKIANKNPFGYIILPKKYLNENPEEAKKIAHNSKQMVSPLDLRATVQHWLTGRDWSASASGERKLPHYSSNYGQSLMVSTLHSNRTCESAGIPLPFCVCNLIPCKMRLKSILNANIPKVVDFINNQILEDSPQALPVCKPLEVSEVIAVPIGEGCYESSNIIIADVYIKRTMFLVSITFEKINNNDLKVLNANTITKYNKVWEVCEKKFHETKILNNIPDDKFQFCYCTKTEGWYPYLLGLSKYFSDRR